MLFAFGFGALLLALFGCIALYRLSRTLAALEETLRTADEAIQEVAPEVRDSLGNVNDVTAGVNVALRVAGGGVNRLARVAARSSDDASAALFGAKVAAGSLWRSFTDPARSRGGQQ